MQKPLSGITILDLTRVLTGPHATMLLADYGADVIRIEHPDRMDDMRYWWPFYKGESTYFLFANRNKRSMTLNLKSEPGRTIFKQLVRDADVVIENLKAGTMARLGLGYEDLKAIKPDLIMCSITGYGQTGPYRAHPGYDPVIQAIGGMMSITGHPDCEPTRVGVPIVDILSSLHVAISIFAALRMREVNGTGQHIDVSLLDVQVSSLANVASSYLQLGHIYRRAGNRHGNIAPYETFACSDKPLMVAAGNDGLFAKLCNALGIPELADDPRFQTNALRVENREALCAILDPIFRRKTAGEWEQILIEHQVPCGPVNAVDQVFAHPQVKHRQLVVETDHPTLGKIKLVRNPIRYSGFQFTVERHPPLHGEHTEQILTEQLGYSAEDVAALREAGVI